MSYQTGVSGSVNDFIGALFSFLTAADFTESTSWTNGSDTYRTLLKDGIYFVIAFNADNIFLNTATSLSGSGGTTAQPGAASSSMLVNKVTGPHISYHLFYDGMACNAVIEVATNVFAHLNFGFVTKNGVWTGGAFVSGNYTTTTTNLDLLGSYNYLPFHTRTFNNDGQPPASVKQHLRSDITTVNGLSGFGATFTNASTTTFNKAWVDAGGGRMLLNANPNAFNGRSVIVPITLIQSSTGTGGPYYQIGHIPNAGLINIANIEPKAIVNTDWMVFPIGLKGSVGSTYIRSFNTAMAYRQ